MGAGMGLEGSPRMAAGAAAWLLRAARPSWGSGKKGWLWPRRCRAGSARGWRCPGPGGARGAAVPGAGGARGWRCPGPAAARPAAPQGMEQHRGALGDSGSIAIISARSSERRSSSQCGSCRSLCAAVRHRLTRVTSPAGPWAYPGGAKESTAKPWLCCHINLHMGSFTLLQIEVTVARLLMINWLAEFPHLYTLMLSTQT